jgi:hypothetical protein
MKGGRFPCLSRTPQHLGMNAGEFFPMGLNAEMPGDQAGDDALSLCFDGEVLAADLQLLGAARLTLRLSSDRPLAFRGGAAVRCGARRGFGADRAWLPEPVPS